MNSDGEVDWFVVIPQLSEDFVEVPGFGVVGVVFLYYRVGHFVFGGLFPIGVDYFEHCIIKGEAIKGFVYAMLC